MKIKIDELKIGTAPVVTISKNKKAIDAFSIMDRRKLSGVAVVDEQGKLVGSTTASDLKVWLPLNYVDTNLFKFFFKVVPKKSQYWSSKATYYGLPESTASRKYWGGKFSWIFIFLFHMFNYHFKRIHLLIIAAIHAHSKKWWAC